MLIRFFILILALAFTQSTNTTAPAKTMSQPICKVVNADVDVVLNVSNQQAVSYADMVGFKRDVYVTAIWGFLKIIKVSFSTGYGRMSPINTLSRSSNATDCSSPYLTTLSGVFGFDTLSVSFEYAKARFLLWETIGKLVFKLKPHVNVIVAKGSYDCRLESFTLATTEDLNYQFMPYTTNSIWGGLVARIAGLALTQGDSTPLLKSTIQPLQDSVSKYFAVNWCQRIRS